MFGGHVTVPVNSPHLRKSGSRQLFSELETSEMKGAGSTPLAAAAMLPSPVLLWRLKVMLFFLWGFSCCKISWDSVMRMSLDLRDLFLYEAFLYYNPLLLVTAAVWFWGANLWVFSQSNVNYSKIFDLDQNHLTHKEIWKVATWMTIIVPTSMTSYLYLYSHGEVSWAASQPVLLYTAVAIILIFPFDIFYLSSRFFLLRTLWRIVFPFQAIAFADFFVADILTSMSKVFSDLERSFCRMVHRQVATIAWFEADSVCGSHSVAIPIVLVLPYIFRLFQCLRQYKDTKEKTSLLNALKYSTAVPVIFLSALKYHVFPDNWINCKHSPVQSVTMQTPEPFTDLEHEPHTPLLDHHHNPPPPPSQTTTKPLFTRVVSGVTFVLFFFAFAIVFIVLTQQNSSVRIVTNSEKSFIRYSQADRLSWERTAFHFQPAKNFIYDPDGQLFHMGWYHLFYQYNPYAPVWGNMSWGHSVSKDMINWYELPVAMVPTEWYDIEGVLSGSTTVLPNGQIFALYTGNANDFSQLQCKAVPVNSSDPLLIEWVKYEDNPILYTPPGIGLKDYRDPSTVWTGPDGKHRMIMGTKRGNTGMVLVYYTTDYTNYELLDEPLHSVPNTDMWECVDFYPVSLTNDSALDMAAYGSGIKHVIKESWEGHGSDWYSIGTYDAINDKWTPDNPELDVGIGLRCDYGRFFASKSLYDPLKKRRVTWGYVGESDSADQDLSRGWATVYNVGRTIVLDRKTGTHLLHWPVEEVESLRYNGQEFKEIKLEPGSIIPLDIGTATQLDIVATFEVDQAALNATSETDDIYGCTTSLGAAQRGSLGPFGLAVLADGTLSELTPVYFYIAKKADGGVSTHFCTDKLRSSLDYDGERVVYGGTVPVLDDEELTMRLLVDHSIVEGFAQGGRTVITSRAYPTKAIYEQAKLFLFNNATGTSVKASLKIWQMASAPIHQYSF